MRAGVVSALVAVVALGSVGCSPTPEAGPAPSVSATPTTTPSPSPSPTPTTTPAPERPAAMDDVSVDGAIAAATYFLSLYPYVYNTGDLTQWKAMSHPECIFCASVVTDAEEMFAKAIHQEGSGITVSGSTATEITPGEFYQVDVTATQQPWREIDVVGVLVAEGPTAEDFVAHLAIVRDGETWLVREAELEKVEG
jgi:hypothetical protein